MGWGRWEGQEVVEELRPRPRPPMNAEVKVQRPFTGEPAGAPHFQHT